MHRPGTDPSNVQMSDVLCDFCHAAWVAERPMVEGHHGSVICGPCLSVAWGAVIVEGADDASPGWRCTMCLEQRAEPAWRSPAHSAAFICQRCIKLAARQLERDPEFGWKPPGPPES